MIADAEGADFATRDAVSFSDFALEVIAHGAFCAFGWKSPRPCNYTGGCVCWRQLGHYGLCKCDTCGSHKKRPKDWDDVGRRMANA